jgi:hypothetical protein
MTSISVSANCFAAGKITVPEEDRLVVEEKAAVRYALKITATIHGQELI